MKLQNVIYPSPKNCAEEALFFRRAGEVQYYYPDDFITLNKNGKVIFDTYFNSFSIGKWAKYTNVERVFLKIKVCGKFYVSLLYKEKQFYQLNEKIIGEIFIDTKGETAEINIPFDCEKKQGMYAFELQSMEDDGQFFCGEYGTDAAETEDVRIGIIICTFKRETFVYQNMQLLKDRFFQNEYSDLKDRLYVYISDNAKSLDKKRLQSEYIKVFDNKNAGGAGGFTRGMIEAIHDAKEKKLTHVLLMDDDIVLQPESIFRTERLLAHIRPEYRNSYVGGAMLRSDMQWFQTESGALWNFGNLIGRKIGLDLRTLDACLYNEIEEKCDYTAWWYCVIPMEYVREDNLPLPIFIRGDDVEYGLRNMSNLILMNGICVWHEPFEFKYSSAMFYYIFRNRLIDNAVRHIPYSKKQFLKEFYGWFRRELFTYRYKNAELLLQGTYDFLQGIDWLKAQDGEELNTSIMQKGYRLQNVNDLEIPFEYAIYQNTVRQFEGKIHRFKRMTLLNGMFLKTKGDAIVPTIDPHILYFYRKARVLHYDYSSQKGFVTARDNKEFWRLYKLYRKLRRDCNKKYDRIVEEYGRRSNELTSLQFWNHYLGISEE